MNKLFLLLGLLLAQATCAGWLTPEEIEQANARMRVNNEEEKKSTPLQNENPAMGDINKRIRERAATEKGKGPVTVYVGPKQSPEEAWNAEKMAETRAQNSKCEELLTELRNNELGNIGSKTITEVWSIKAKRAAINNEYELRCLSSEERQARKQNRADDEMRSQLRQIQRTQQQMKQQQDHDSTWGKKCTPDGLGNLRCK